MKKIFTILSLMAVSFILTAQTTGKGNMFIGTNSNLTHSTLTADGGGDSESILSLNGQYGYFFTDNICAGAGINYMSVGGETITGLGLFGRYYFEEGKMYGHIGYDTGDKLVLGILPIEDYSALNLAFGYCVWLGNNITFEPSLMYTNMHTDGERIGSMFDIKLGFGLYF